MSDTDYRYPSILIEMTADNNMSAKGPDTRNKIAVLLWLCTVSGLGAMKIIIGSISINGGCLGLTLLPYFFLVGGVLAMVPAGLTILTSCCTQSDSLREMWGLMAKLFALWLILIITGTVYLVTNAVRVISLDRLCGHPWVVILAFCVLIADWLTVIFFYRLFCVFESLPDIRSAAAHPCTEDSPFSLWRMRSQRLEINSEKMRGDRF